MPAKGTLNPSGFEKALKKALVLGRLGRKLSFVPASAVAP